MGGQKKKNSRQTNLHFKEFTELVSTKGSIYKQHYDLENGSLCTESVQTSAWACQRPHHQRS